MLKKCAPNDYTISTFPLTKVHLKWAARAIPIISTESRFGTSFPATHVIDNTYYDESMMLGIRYLNYYLINKRSTLFV